MIWSSFMSLKLFIHDSCHLGEAPKWSLLVRSSDQFPECPLSLVAWPKRLTINSITPDLLIGWTCARQETATWHKTTAFVSCVYEMRSEFLVLRRSIGKISESLIVLYGLMITRMITRRLLLTWTILNAKLKGPEMNFDKCLRFSCGKIKMLFWICIHTIS